MTNTIPTFSDQMIEDLRNAIDVQILPGGPESFQAALIDAEKAGASDVAGMAKLVSLANAALVVADQDDGMFGPWYREKARNLLARTVDALVMMDATANRSSAGSLN